MCSCYLWRFSILEMVEIGMEDGIIGATESPNDLDGLFRYSFRIPFQMSIHEHTCTIGKSDSLLAGNLTVKTCMQQSFSRNISGNGIAWSLSSIYILVIQIAMFSTFRQIGCPCNQDSLSR